MTSLQDVADDVRRTLLEHQMLDGIQRLGIALSGGADSLGLLHILLSCHLEDLFGSIEFVPLHVSQYDPTSYEQLSEFISHEYGLELHVARHDTRDVAEQLIARGKAPCRACAPRRSRVIGRLSAELELDSVAFGHHLTDAAATLLLNMFHEGTTRPLMPVVTRGRGSRSYRVIRPLYYTAEAHVKQISPVRSEGLFNCGSCILHADERERNRRFVEQTFEQHRQTRDYARRLLRALTADTPASP